MERDLDRNAFESAVARLPHPVFIVDDRSNFRPVNDSARDLSRRENLDEMLLRAQPHHPVAQVVTAIRTRGAEAEDSDPLFVTLSGGRYEVICSHSSPRGAARWLMLMLRPVSGRSEVDPAELRKRWALTPREAEIAAASISGQTTAEICERFSISRQTLKSHMARILDKSGCETRLQLTSRYFIEQPGRD